MIVTRSANLKFLHQLAQHGSTEEHRDHVVPDHGEVTVTINVLLKSLVIMPCGITVGLGSPAASHSGYKNFGQWGPRDRQTTRIVAWHAAKNRPICTPSRKTDGVHATPGRVTPGTA